MTLDLLLINIYKTYSINKLSTVIVEFDIMSPKKFFSQLIRSWLIGSPVRILLGPIAGWKWLVESGNNSYWLGIYEQKYVQTFSQQITLGNTVFDIGSQAGYYTLIASRLTGKDGQVFSFEPFPPNIDFVKKHCHLNNCTNVKLFEVGVGGSSGKRKFQANNSFMGHFSRHGELEVDVVTLDELAAKKDIAPPNVIKIDVEGMEYWVLRGGEKLILKYKPTIFVATHGKGNNSRVLQLLQDWGYDIVMIGNGSERNADYMAKFLSIA